MHYSVLRGAIPPSGNPGKIFQDLQTHFPALFRMELAGEHISLFHRGMDLRAVFGGSFYNGRILRTQIIGMHKIDIRFLGNSPKQAAVMLQPQGVPSNMGNL